MRTFAQEVMVNPRYKSLKKRRVDGRTIEECIIGIGEGYASKIVRQLSNRVHDAELRAQKLKGQLDTVRVSGKLDLARQQIGFMRYMTWMRGLGEFAVTPFNQMRLRYFEPALLEDRPRTWDVDHSRDEVIDPEPANGDSTTIVDGATEPEEEENEAGFDVPGLDAAGDPDPQESALPPDDPDDENTLDARLYAALPEWMQRGVEVVKTVVTRMTPLSTALLVIVVVVGMYAYGKYSQSYLEKSYNLVVGRADELSKSLAEEKAKLAKLQGVEKTNAANEATITSLRGSLEQANQRANDLARDLKTSQDANKEETTKLTSNYLAQLNEARANADAELKKQIAALEAEKIAWVAERDQLKTENARLKPLADQVPGLQDSLKTSSATIDRQITDSNVQATQLATAKSDLQALNALLWGSVQNLKTGLLTTGEEWMKYHQKDFKERFNKQLKACPEVYKKYGYNPF